MVLPFGRFSAVAPASQAETATSLDETVYIVGNAGVRGIGIFDHGKIDRDQPTSA